MVWKWMGMMDIGSLGVKLVDYARDITASLELASSTGIGRDEVLRILDSEIEKLRRLHRSVELALEELLAYRRKLTGKLE